MAEKNKSNVDSRILKDSEKIQVTFNQTQLELLDKFKGIFGDTRAEVVRYIVANWLLDKTSIDKIKKDENTK